jgi:lysyl-tRNA synthetase class 2
MCGDEQCADPADGAFAAWHVLLSPEVSDPAMPSTVIRSFHYEAALRELRIEFQSGRKYVYRDVPAETVEAMRKASSKGAFFNMHIRGRYGYTPTN